MTELSELYDKDVKCPVCLRQFTTKKARTSRLRAIKRDEDFLNYYKTENPIKYSVFVCPNCGYASIDDKFENISREDAGIILDNVTSRWKSRDFGGVRTDSVAIETYKLALISCTLLGYKKLEQGNICLNIGWLYRLKGNQVEEKRFLEFARDKFIEAYNNESLSGTNMDESKLTYLIGELSRRIDDKEEAQTWFAASMNLPSTKLNPGLDKLLREQWRITKEME